MASILLIDDEPQLLRLMQVYLTKLGHTVNGCATAAAARAAFAANGSSYELIVADLTLPDGDGAELAVELANQNPAVAVLLCSGYPYELSALPESVRSRADMLLKPFLPNMLAKSVEQLIKKRR